MILGMPKRALLIGAGLVAVVLIYVFSSGNDASAGSDDDPDSSKGKCEVSVSADMLNVRAEPDVDSDVVDQLEGDAEVEAGTEVRDGYRQLGEERWAADKYLEPVGDTEC